MTSIGMLISTTPTITKFILDYATGTVHTYYVETVAVAGGTRAVEGYVALQDGVGALANPGWTDADLALAVQQALGTTDSILVGTPPSTPPDA